MNFGDFIALDAIVNKDQSLLAQFLAPKGKRAKRKAYERWVNSWPGFDGHDVVRMRLNEAAARIVFGNDKVEHYLAAMEHQRPWQEPFYRYWGDHVAACVVPYDNGLRYDPRRDPSSRS